MKYIVNDFEKSKEIAKKILSDRTIKFILLNGELGAGKTSLTKIIAQELGIKENIVSPTFNVMITYDKMVHIDAYKISGDLDEYEDFFDDKLVIIEWSDNLDMEFKNSLRIDIYFDNNNNRIYELDKEL